MFKISLIDVGVKVITKDVMLHLDTHIASESAAVRIVGDLMGEFDFETKRVASNLYIVTARNVYYGCYTITEIVEGEVKNGLSNCEG